MSAPEGTAISPREAEVLDALAERLTNAEIADRLYISVRTVETHVSALLRKFNARSRRELADTARRRGTRGRGLRPLPPRVTACLGRQGDIVSITALLERSRVVTLTGPAGVGKTRLVIEVAAPIESAREVAFVDLTSATDEAAVVTAFAAALDVAGEAGTETRAGLLEFLRTDRELLLVVDNCEHVLEPAAELVVDAVGASGAVRVLATSREAFTIPGERVFSVNPLDAASAAELFWDRAVSVEPSLPADSSGATEAVRSICRRLDGVPLAIELAAAQASLLTPQQIDARLNDRFSLLRSPARGRSPRHAALEAALGWSYDLLDARERVLLDRLAVFRGRFGLAAVEAVATGPPVERDAVIELLGRLVRKSLVVPETVGDERRYRLLETIREYAWARVHASHELDSLRQRHLLWVLGLLEQAIAGLQSGAQHAWFETLDEELPNIEWALEWSLGTPELAARALSAVEAMRNYWMAGGSRRQQGLRWLHLTAEAATSVGAAPRTRALVDAVLLLSLDDVRAATAFAKQARLVAGDDPLARAYAALAAAIVAVHVGNGQVEADAGRALEAIGPDDQLHWWAHGMLALHLGQRGRFAEAATRLREASDGFRRLGDEHLGDSALTYVADLELAAGDVDMARADTARALAVAHRFECASCESQAVANLALIGDSDPEERLSYARRALRLAYGIRETWNMLAGLDVVAAALVDVGRLHDALLVGSAAHRLRAESGYDPVLPTRAGALEGALVKARADLDPAVVDALEREGMTLGFDSAIARAVA